MHDELMAVLLQEDDLGAVIRAHLYIEQDIDHIVSMKVANHDYISKLDMGFSKKIILAVALGLAEDLFKPLKSITNIRNKFAHKPKMEMKKSDINNFYKSFSSNDQEAIQKFVSSDPKIPRGVAKRYPLLSIKEKFVVLTFHLAFRVRGEWRETFISEFEILDNNQEDE